MITIAEFAARTGLSASALRFYESKALLIPAERLDNGYRRYSEEQIHRAKQINSLRQAGVGLADIRRFVEADAPVKHQLLERWRREAEARMLSVQIANQYLNGIRPDGGGSLHLVRWEEPALFLWQPFRLGKPVSGYASVLEAAAERLKACRIRAQGPAYIRVIESQREELLLEAGHPVHPSSERQKDRLPPQAYFEPMPPALFVSVDSSWEDSHVCMRTIRFLDKFGFKPAGKRLERHFPPSPLYEIMIPVVHSQSTLDLQPT